jgi:hypothetical protein
MEQTKKNLVDVKIETKILLAGFWLVVMLLYVYCDIFLYIEQGK